MIWVVGLDALRLFAITLVVIYHLFRGVLPGGFLAIEIFLVISGYLLGTNLLRDCHEKGNFGTFKFIRRRIARLWPALFVCVVFTLCLAFFSPHGVLEGLHLDSLFALLFSTNIQEIIQGGSYEELTMPNLFEHCWFLALEFQLCISLPLVLSLAAIRARRYGQFLKRVILLSTCIAIISAALMYVYAVLYHQENRAYFAVDTQAFAFYLGVGIAARNLLKPQPGRRRRWPAIIPLIGALVALTYLAIHVEFDNAFSGYLQFAAVLSAILIASILRLQRKRTSLPFWLRPLEFMGKHSFGIYLFHWPLYILLPRIFEINVAENAALCIVLSLTLAVVSGQLLKLRARYQFPLLVLPTAFAVYALIAIPMRSDILVQLESQEEEREAQKVSYVQELNLDALIKDVTEHAEKAEAAEAEAEAEAASAVPSISTWAPTGATPSSYANGASVLVIGDSVVLGAKADLEAAIPGVYVDAMESRGIEKASVILDSVAASGQIPPVVVVGLATNHRTFTDYIMQQVVDSARGSTVVFVTAYAGEAQPREAQNAAIMNFANSHDNVYYADWWSIAVSHYELLYDDHIHLNPDGRRVYANLIYTTLQGAGLL